MADMIKFYKGLEASLPASGINGALYITTDEGAIYLGTGTGMKRLGDFIQVANVKALPTAGANTTALYYCVEENILAKWNGTSWTQVNKQPTVEELKELLALGDLAYLSEVTENDLATALATKINNKVDKNGTDRLITEAEAAKLELLVIDEETGQAAISGTVNASQVQGLADLLNEKVSSVTAGDASITVAGTANDPTVAVKISTAEGNALELAADGLKVNIPESTVVEDSETNGYIKVDGEEVQVFNDIFDCGEQKTVVAAGGIAANSTVHGKTFQQILYNMMFPYQKPTVSASASPNGGTYMKGNKQTVTKVTASVTKKTDNIAKVELFNSTSTLNSTTLVEEKTGDAVANGGSIVFTVSREVSSNGGQYRVRVTDTSGGSNTADTGSFSFINPYYYGVIAANATIDEALIEGLTSDLKAKGTKTYSYTTNSQKMLIAYPKAYGTLKSVKDGNGLDNTGAFGTPVTVNITNQYGNAEDYYVYTNGVTSGSASMTFTHN